MSEMKFTNKEQAKEILKVIENCSICKKCVIDKQNGWKCRSIKETAEKYLKDKKERDQAQA